MKVADVMSSDVVTVSPKTSFPELWRLIFKKHIHCLPVISEKNILQGFITEEDLVKPLYPNYRDLIDDFARASDFEAMEKQLKEFLNLCAEDIMNKRVIFTRSDTPIMRALSRMIVRQVRQLPVLNEHDKVVGVVAKSDIFDALFREMAMKNDGKTRVSLKKSLRRR